MDEDLRVGQGHALVLSAAREQQSAHAHRHADADRRDVWLDELHCVVDRKSGIHRAARGVDVDRDVLVGVLRLEMDQLRNDQVGDVLGDRGAEKDDPLVEQPRVDVEGALAARGLFDHHRDQGAHEAASLTSSSRRPAGLGATADAGVRPRPRPRLGHCSARDPRSRELAVVAETGKRDWDRDARPRAGPRHHLPPVLTSVWVWQLKATSVSASWLLSRLRDAGKAAKDLGQPRVEERLGVRHA